MATRNGKNPIEKPTRGVGRNPTLTPGNPGNSGGKPGRSGRKSNTFIERCEAMTDEEVLDAIEAYFAHAKKHRANPLYGPADNAWRWCAEYVTRYTKSEPKRKVELSGDEDLPVRFTVNLAAASLAGLPE